MVEQFDLNDLLRFSIKHYNSQLLEVILKHKDYLLLKTSRQDDINNTNLRNFNESSILLINLAKEQSGFKDRILDIKGEPYEVMSIECIMRSITKIYEFNKETCVPETICLRKNSQELLNFKLENRKFGETQEVLLKKFNTVDIYETQITKGKNVLISYFSILNSWIF